jgi:hypothetical protein
VVGERFLFFTDGASDDVLRLDMSTGTVDSLATGIAAQPQLTEEVMIEVGVAIASETRPASFDRPRYRERLEQVASSLHTAFSGTLPRHTQLFAISESVALVRHFDVRGRMGGLAETWSVVSFRDRTVRAIRLASLGQARAIGVTDESIMIAHQHLEWGRYNLTVSEYPRGDVW